MVSVSDTSRYVLQYQPLRSQILNANNTEQTKLVFTHDNGAEVIYYVDEVFIKSNEDLQKYLNSPSFVKILEVKNDVYKIQFRDVIYNHDDTDTDDYHVMDSDDRYNWFNVSENEEEEVIVNEEELFKMCQLQAIDEFNKKYERRCKNITDVYKYATLDEVEDYNLIEQTFIKKHYPQYSYSVSCLKINGTIDDLLHSLNEEIETSEDLEKYHQQTRHDVNNVIYSRKLNNAYKYFNKLDKQLTDETKRELRLSNEEIDNTFSLLKYSYLLDLTDCDIKQIQKILKIRPPKQKQKQEPQKTSFRQHMNNKHKTDSSTFKSVTIDDKTIGTGRRPLHELEDFDVEIEPKFEVEETITVLDTHRANLDENGEMRIRKL